MAKRYTHEDLTHRVKSPGWALVTEKSDQPVSGTLEHILGITHQRKKGGQAPGLIEELETGLALDMIQIEKLWRYLGLPV
jgi:hypothetical protein